MKSTAPVSGLGSLSLLLAHLSTLCSKPKKTVVITKCGLCVICPALSVVNKSDLVEFYQKHSLLWLLQCNIPLSANNALLSSKYWLH